MNGRKARQLRSQGGQKRLRRYRKDVRAAEEALRAEAAEAQAAYEEANREILEALAQEPQYAIIDPFSGSVAMMAAQSMIWPLGVNGKGESLDDPEVAAAADEALARFNKAVEGLPETTSEENPDVEAAPKVILPGTAEALGVEAP